MTRIRTAVLAAAPGGNLGVPSVDGAACDGKLRLCGDHHHHAGPKNDVGGDNEPQTHRYLPRPEYVVGIYSPKQNAACRGEVCASGSNALSVSVNGRGEDDGPCKPPHPLAVAGATLPSMDYGYGDWPRPSHILLPLRG